RVLFRSSARNTRFDAIPIRMRPAMYAAIAPMSLRPNAIRIGRADSTMPGISMGVLVIVNAERVAEEVCHAADGTIPVDDGGFNNKSAATDPGRSPAARLAHRR